LMIIAVVLVIPVELMTITVVLVIPVELMTIAVGKFKIIFYY
jgi:hypothetical protein